MNNIWKEMFSSQNNKKAQEQVKPFLAYPIPAPVFQRLPCSYAHRRGYFAIFCLPMLIIPDCQGVCNGFSSIYKGLCLFSGA